MKYGVIGSGAVGCYYGGRLAQAGHDVHFLFHSDYDHIRQHGLQVNSHAGSFHLDEVKAYRSADDMPPCDVVIVALKTVNIQLLARLLPPLLKPDTLVLAIQNGIGVEAEIERLVPGVKLAAGLAFICAAKTSPGVVDHMDLGAINIGNYNAPATQVDALVADFQQAGIAARSVDYLEARWHKALWNIPFNGLSVLLETSTDRLLDQPDTLALVRSIMLEVVRAARASGCTTLDEAAADRLIEMTRNMKPYSPSMKLDWDFHRPMEIEFIHARAVAEAAQHDAPMPQVAMLMQALRFKEATRQA